ncbi:1,4-dihydroxy-2-naphthoate polyprenyltransferase [Salibacteraceae bacterium]|nr:1,4-dihydroxy-2-naphthoate polyprenyltransferase [Salibacteraceae bacterium]MDA9938164.1 1,4-dihydroxy-2-naphthoate polyprenyltransferase [Salibacteraceae bacterium]
MKKWLNAFRLKTLPLAFSSIIMGAAVSYDQKYFNWLILALAILTSIFLQILSNLANDYGDAISGVDNENRLGPIRAIQSGQVTVQQMKIAVILFSLLSFISGISLLVVSFSNITILFLLFLLVGLLAIAAAIKYTIGKNAYGYSGLGDISVFVFFGVVGVIGSSYLFNLTIELVIILPAISIGVFSVGVLNLNNLRDIDNDAKHGKNTLAVKFGRSWAKNYHYALITTGWLLFVLFLYFSSSSLLGYLPLLLLPVFIANLRAVKNHTDPQELINKLKQLALGTFGFALLYFISVLIS